LFDRDVEAFREARAANFMLLSGTQGDDGIRHNFEGMRYALRVADAAGVRYLVSDYRFYEAYEKPWTFPVGQSVIDDYAGLPLGSRNAMYGYFLTDEPHFTSDHFSHVSAWVRFLQLKDPSRLALVNLVPCYATDSNWGGFVGGNNDGLLDMREKVEYEGYLHLYVDSLQPSVVCFDHYPFMRDGSIRRDYLYNLGIIRKMAGSIPFWASPMTADHLSYVDPSAEHLRFMYFVPAAYGAKGLMIFTYSTPPSSDYRSALIGRDGKKTAKYGIVSQLNSYFRSVMGTVLMNDTCVAVYNLSTFPGNQVFVDTGIPSDSPYLVSINDDRLLASVFEGPGTRYLLVVNKDLKTATNVEIALKGAIPSVSFAPRLVGFKKDSSLEYKAEKTQFQAGAIPMSIFRIPELLGGEGRLIRIM
jgi:hypothetical protein